MTPRRARRYPVAGLAVASLLGLCATLLAGCTDTTPVGRNTLRNPRALAIACKSGDGYLPIADCKANADVRAYVAGGSIGSIAIAEPERAAWIDADPKVPGFNPRMVGDLPQAMAGDPLGGGVVYFGLGLKARLGRMSLADLSLAFVDLDFVPAGIASAKDAGGGVVLWVADPSGGRVRRVSASAFDAQGSQTTSIVGGSPWSLAALPDGRVVVGHLNHDYVSILDANGAVVAEIGLGPACSDGVDNDGDGKTDRADPGCDDGADGDEADPVAAAEACRDGVDNDGDGKTDYPDDPGCGSFAGASEARDARACADGVDNDGDGQTDFPDDSDCASADDEGERGAPVAGVVGPCNDGVDNDGDGQTDFPFDLDCASPIDAGEVRPVCADGIDNDGDGDTDLADDACYNRTSPSETAADTAAVAVVAASFDGRYVAIGHRSRRALYVLDTQTNALVVPAAVAGQSAFARPSRLDAKEGLRGLALPTAALAVAPIRYGGKDAFAVTLAMNGLVIVQLEGAALDAATSALAIGLLGNGVAQESSAIKPSLTVEGLTIDIGDIPPPRYANPGLLTQDETDDGRTSWYGLVASPTADDHRTETWRLISRGQIPGSARRSGRLLRSDLLVDATADFCAMGVVPGDDVILRRGAGAPDCQGWVGDALRYRVLEVGPDSLRIDAQGGVVDVPMRASDQLGAVTPPAATVPPPLGCVPLGGLDYEVRAAGWLVMGVRSGLLSSRPRQGGACAPWDEHDPLLASRIVEPVLKAGVAAPASCPISDADLAADFVTPPYGGGKADTLRPFENAVFSVQLRPGCAPSDVPGELPRLLPSIRDATWRYGVRAGFTPRVSAVGTAAYGVASGPGLTRAYVADQGSGTLSVVDVATGAITQQLD